jgi:hypothetical protein
MASPTLKLAVEIVLGMGEREWFQAEDFEVRFKRAGGVERSRRAIYHLLRRVSVEMDTGGHRLRLQRFRGRGYRLWPRREK